MNKIIALLAGVLVFSACTNNKTETTEPVAETKTAEVKPLPAIFDSIKYKNWEMGNPENMTPVLNFYKLWDSRQTPTLASLFGDSVSLRIPEEREELIVPNNQVHDVLVPNMDMYTATSNSLVSIVSLHDRDSKEDWVLTIVYAKWQERTGKRDSVVYSDKWRIKDGKIVTMLSFDKKVTHSFLQRNFPKK